MKKTAILTSLLFGMLATPALAKGNAACEHANSTARNAKLDGVQYARASQLAKKLVKPTTRSHGTRGKKK
jgi:hypothetical protein